jgi:hypothetical protein
LWTDALGLSRDEANQEAYEELTGLKQRKLQMSGTVPAYRAIDLKELESDGREILGDGQPALVQRTVGQGTVSVASLLAGLSYSTRVRRGDFDMGRDFDETIRKMIAAPAVERTARPVVTSSPLVEAVLLEQEGRRSVVLMNWNYRHDEHSADHQAVLQPAENLRIEIGSDFRGAQSLTHGKLPVQGRQVILPRLETADVLILE